MSPNRRSTARGLPLVLLLALLGWALYAGRANGLVVYCAHDSLYSAGLLARFERETGIAVHVRYDTEATKSLGLVELLSKEGPRSDCDVFWNNEPLGTLRLAEEGLLMPYRGPGFARIPDAFKDPRGRWAGFAGRLRVWIVNTQRMPADLAAIDKAIADGLARNDLSRVAIAKPLWGTTRTHYTYLWDLLGAGGLTSWHTSWRRAGVRELEGNSRVKDAVARGACDLGLTDSDDFNVALRAGAPVAMVPVMIGRQHTILIPNTVAILRATDRPEQAKRLVDFLLSETSELALASSPSRQIPLGTVDEARIPQQVRAWLRYRDVAYRPKQLERARTACLAFLRREYLE